MTEQSSRLLARMAERASRDPGYVGYALERYCATEKISLHTLGTFLQIKESALASLRLCRRPRPDRFIEDLNLVAAHVSAEATVLAAILRQVDAVDTMRGGASNERGFLLAARERVGGLSANPDPDAADDASEPDPREDEG